MNKIIVSSSNFKNIGIMKCLKCRKHFKEGETVYETSADDGMNTYFICECCYNNLSKEN